MKTTAFICNYGLALLLSVTSFTFAQEAFTPRAEKKPTSPEASGLTPEMEKKALDSIRQIYPKLAEDLEKRKSWDPLGYLGELRTAISEMYEIEMLLKANPEAREKDAMQLKKEAMAKAELAQVFAYTKQLELEKMRRDDPIRIEREQKIRQLELNSQEMAATYHNAQDEAARKTIRTNLANVVTQLFDLREMNRQDDVKRMEAELKRLNETLDQRQKNRAVIIERRVQQLTGEVGAMEWE